MMTFGSFFKQGEKGRWYAMFRKVNRSFMLKDRKKLDFG
jgi:hypothetical protein